MTGFLIFLIIALTIIVLVQVTKTLDLVSELREDEQEEERYADFHSRLMVIFLIAGLFGFFWSFGAYRDKLFPAAASEHGEILNNLFFWTLLVTGIVFVITNIALFAFAYIYRWRNKRKAAHIAHNNLLEFVWTFVPAVVLTFLVWLGLRAWYQITSDASEDAFVFEVTGQQFFWSSRYPGPDGQLGIKDYNLISANNPLGVVLPVFVEDKRAELLTDLANLRDREEELPALIEETAYFIEHDNNPHLVDSAEVVLEALEDELKELPGMQKRRRAHYVRIMEKFTPEYMEREDVKPLIEAGADDFQPSELHLPNGQECVARITAQDVLHNFYIPYMSVKMDAVPGIPTRFKFTPKITTEEMRQILRENPEWQSIPEGKTVARWETFVYEVACAELCGKGHNSMRYELYIDEEEDFNAWLTQQQPYLSQVEANLVALSAEEYDQLEREYVYVEPAGGHHGGDHHDDHGEVMIMVISTQRPTASHRPWLQ
jgi:heme/copper-type cytochrome/quinol oxidase subunit 2